MLRKRWVGRLILHIELVSNKENLDPSKCGKTERRFVILHICYIGVKSAKNVVIWWGNLYDDDKKEIPSHFKHSRIKIASNHRVRAMISLSKYMIKQQ